MVLSCTKLDPLTLCVMFDFDFDSETPTVKNAIRNVYITRFQPLANSFLFLRYNSALSVSLPAHGYARAVVSESFLRRAPWADASRAIPKSVDWPPKELFDPITVLKDM